MGSVSIDLSLSNIWKNWYKFRQGKRKTKELEHFQYFLEENLRQLHFDLNSGQYQHGGYRKFIVEDTKRREISVADIRDRIVHRLLYEYLTEIYDKTFIYDVWSCRKNKGLVGAIERAQNFLKKYSKYYVWRTDIKKFFDNIDHQILMKILSLKIINLEATYLLKEIIRFVKHIIKPQAYLRYGDDFIIISDNLNKLKLTREEVKKFLVENLRLEINAQNDIIVKAKRGLKFLGIKIFPKGKTLNKRNWQKARARLNLRNISSYSGLVRKYSAEKRIKEFNWIILDKLSEEIR